MVGRAAATARAFTYAVRRGGPATFNRLRVPTTTPKHPAQHMPSFDAGPMTGGSPFESNAGADGGGRDDRNWP
ncbi:MAG: hypothetical protein LC808_32000, partial [Actinobacteria bacterium]|nr:hypothetical protein [Actinomycetota bacterium]